MPNTVKESSVRRTAAPPSPTPPPAAPQPVRPRLPPAGVQLSTLAWQLAAGCAGILLGAGQIYGGAAPFGLALAIGCAPGYLPAASLGAIVGSLAFLPLAQAGPLSLAVLAVLAARRLRPRPALDVRRGRLCGAAGDRHRHGISRAALPCPAGTAGLHGIAGGGVRSGHT